MYGSVNGHAGLSAAGYAEARLASVDYIQKNFNTSGTFETLDRAGDKLTSAFPGLTSNVPGVGNSSAVLAGVTVDATAAAEVDVFLSVDTGK